MKTFQELINERGDDFINRLFTMPVTVYEKLDASQFSFEKDSEGMICFYKQDQNTPISKIDITLSQYYNGAIKHIQNLPADKVDLIPANWRFCCEYFIDRNPVYISYDQMPKNGLVLINIIDNSTKNKKVLDNKILLSEWSEFLDVEEPPIIFQGVLTEDQKTKIIEFIRTPVAQLKDKFQTNSFIRHLLSILSPSKTNSFLRETDRGLIEGVVFHFGEDEEHYTAKIIDPIFYSRKVDNKDNKSSAPSDVYWLTLIDAIEYLQGVNLQNLQPVGNDSEERYLDIICKIFNAFILRYGNKYKGVDFELPKFMQKEAFRVGMEYIPNKETSKYILEDESWQNVFKVLLAAFRKRKKGTNQLFTEYVLNRFNLIVDEISSLCQTPELPEEDDTDVGLLTFDQMKRYGKITDIDESEEKPIAIAEDTSKVNKQIKLFKEEAHNYNRETISVSALIDTFEFFTNEHLEVLQEINTNSKSKVVLVNIRTNHNLTMEEVQHRVLNTIEREYRTLIEDVVNVRSSDISEILSVLLSKGYEPNSIIIQKQYSDYFNKQIESSDLHGVKLEVKTLLKDPDYSKLYKYVLSNSWADFRRYVPTPVLNYFEAYKIKDSNNA
jgi:hypothetical protein